MAGAVVAAPIVGGLVGNVMSQGDRNAAKKAMKQAYAELAKAGYPPDLSKQIIYKQFEQAGVLTPQLEEDIHMAQSEFNNIKEDPHLRETQLEALNKFKQQADGGMAADERAAYNQMLQGVRQDTRSKTDQILADQQRRGQGAGSGNSLIAQLQAAQSGADQAANQSNDLMALLAQRVRQGTQDMSGAAQQVRSQDYNVASNKASALDARNQFMQTNSMARQQRNTDRNNDAQQMNLANRQDMMNRNTQQDNAERLRQVQEQGNLYDRNLNLAQAKAAARTGQQQYHSDQAAQTAAMYAGVGKSIGEGVSAYAKKKE